ncbi:hypothetical protein ACHAXN_013449 [Cyclotella atomus]
MLSSKPLAAGLLLALLAQCTLKSADAFAVSSSQSPKRKQITNQGKAAGGFAKQNDSVPITHTADTSPSTQNLLNFLLQWNSEGLGASDSGTEVGFDTTNNIRGLYATKSFKKGEILCKIPSDVALALTDPSTASGEQESVVDGGVNFLEWYVNKADARGMWSAYLDTLPTRDAYFDPTPDFYYDAEIDELELPMIVKAAKERKQQISELSQSKNIPFDELQFATWLVASRSFAIKISVDDSKLVREGAVSTTDKAIRVLLPYLDMINHSSDNANAELHLVDPEKDDAWFAIRATRPIKAGKEITISYGASGVETSAGLLMNYGFVPDENKIDAMFMKKGGDDCIASLDGWKTTLEEDEALMAAAAGNMLNVLKLRMKLKKAYPSD